MSFVQQTHVDQFRIWLAEMQTILPLVGGVVDGLFDQLRSLEDRDIPPAKSIMIMPATAKTRDTFTPLCPLIGLINRPHFYSETEPVLAMYLAYLTTTSPPEIPVAAVLFPDGRRVVQVNGLLLDTAGLLIEYDRHPSGWIVPSDEARATRSMAEHLIRNFPAMADPHGEIFRSQALEDILRNAPQ